MHLKGGVMPSRSKIFFIIGVVFLIFFGLATSSFLSAATYYVDPLNGNNGNSGLTRLQAWRNVPGSYKQDNTGFLAASGWVRIRSGDAIKIRSGATIANRLIIDWSWYDNGTPESPIIIARDDAWGSGYVIFDGSRQTLGPYDPMIFLGSRNHVRLDGVTPIGIIVQNANGRGFQATGTSETAKMAGTVVKNLGFYNNLKFNVVLQRCDSFYLENIEIDGNRKDTEESGGLYIGDNTYGCSNGKVVSSASYNHGNTPGTQGGGTSARIGFWLTNSSNVTFENCMAYNNEGNGFDVGVVGSPPSAPMDNIKYVNCVSFNNSNGFSTNLDDIPGSARTWYVNCIAVENAGAGWMVYDGASTRIYNCLSADNRWGAYLDAPPYANRDTTVDLKNTIFYRNSGGGSTSGTWDLWVHRAGDLRLTSDYNHFEQGTQSTCIAWNGAVESDLYYYNMTDAPGDVTRKWFLNHGQDSHSLCSIDGSYARFIDEYFRLGPDSSLIGKGTVIADAGLPEIQKDRDGNPRPANGPWDIGPYQSATVECVFSLDPTEVTVAASGGSGSISVTASSPGCGWTAASNDPWLVVTSGASGTGSGTVGCTVAPNTGPARTGTIVIAGATFTVNQEAFTCSYSISPSSRSFTSAGGSGSISVTASSPGCAWTAVSNSAWLVVTSGASGTGSGTVGYTVAPNTGPARTGTIVIAGATFTVNQASPSQPKISVSPAAIDFGYVRRGRTKSSHVTVSNTGSGVLTIISIGITGNNPGDFRQSNNCSSLTPGSRCRVTVTFAPSAIGLRTANLLVSSNDPTSPNTAVSLRGTGY
jgi:hypothetical protein